MHQINTLDACAFIHVWPILHLEGCITYAYFWENFLTKELMESFYKKNYWNALAMVNVNVCFDTFGKGETR
jgi:hypothetical protein